MSGIDKLIASLAAKVASRKGLMSGILGSLDTGVVAEALNENPRFISRLIAELDPGAVAGAINDNPDFLSRLIKKLDAEVIAGSINSNQGFVARLVDAIHPNVFSRSTNLLFNKIKKATYRPGLSEVVGESVEHE
jgi:hypothetical protein